MIQFNLLPDVKLEYIKARRTKRMVIGVSILASAAALVVFSTLIVTVDVLQKKNINDLTSDIQKNYKTIQSTPDLAKILTVQGQVNSLNDLHSQKPVASRLFGYLSQLTPKSASISQITVDFTQNTMTINGDASALDVVNTFVDSLKYTTYQITGSAASNDSKPAFSQVILANFSRSSTQATYSITLSFDPVIFSDDNSVTLSVGGNSSGQQLNSIIFKQDPGQG